MGRRVALSFALAAALVALGTACGGGGGGGGGGPVEPPAATLSFTPTSAAPANSVSLVRTNGTDPNLLVLELRATGVTDLYGVAFDLSYPSSLRYDSTSEGTWLSSNGAQTSLQVAEQTGKLVIGHSRLGGIGGSTGDGTLLTLRFTAVTAGTGALTFSDTEAFNSGSVAYTVQWIGGSVAVTR